MYAVKALGCNFAGCSFPVVAPTFAIMMVAIYYAAPEEKKIWGHNALVIAILYAAIASIVNTSPGI